MSEQVVWDLTIPSLHKVFAEHFMFGNILCKDFDSSTEIAEMFKYHFNVATAENAMKPNHISKALGEYNFTQADKIVNWAKENNILLVGHTLVWHGQTALWLNRNPDGTALTRAEAKANMEAFIKTYVSRYSGQIYSWDVLNEPFRDDNQFEGNWRNHIRRETNNERAIGHWYLAYANGANKELGEDGCDFVFDAFYFARRHDPHAKLYVNEYNEEYPTKRECIAQMVDEINQMWVKHSDYDGRLLIEGIGMQMHCNENTSLDNIRKSIERFIKTGATISITEMDMTFGSSASPCAPLTSEQNEKQADFYVALFKMFIEFSDHIERVTMWGKDDLRSWRDWGSPLFFDVTGKAKLAYDKVIALVSK